MAKKSKLQGEILQTRPFRSIGQEAYLGVLRTADLLRRRTARLLAASELTPQQYNVLRILRGAGEEGLPTLGVAERMIEHTPGITRLIDRLSAKGLVRRERSVGDRRRVVCWITPAGSELVAALDDPIDAADESFVGALDRSEQRQLIDLLDRVREAMASG